MISAFQDLIQQGDLFRLQWIPGLVACAIVIATYGLKRFPRGGEGSFIVPVTWAYFLASAVIAADLTQLDIPLADGHHLLDVGHSAAVGALELALIPGLLLLTGQMGRVALGVVLAVLSVVNLGSVILTDRGMYSGDTWALSASAMMLPLFLRIGRRWGLGYLALLLIAAVTTHGGTIWYMLAAGGASYLASDRELRVPWWQMVALGLVCLAGAFAFAYGGPFYTSGRWAEWVRVSGWWQDSGKVWFGTGCGTFEWMGPYMDLVTSGRLVAALHGDEVKNAFMWLHSDWLQALVEGGVVGFTLLLGLYVWALVRTRDTPWLFSAWILAGVCALAQFPLHWFLTQVWLAYLVAETLEVSTEFV